MKFLDEMKELVISGKEITPQQSISLIECDESELFEAANEIRQAFCGDKFDLCSIVNAKSGRCSEDCKYCAQSAHYKTGCDTYGLLSKEEFLQNALENQKSGVHRFSLVASGRGLTKNDSDLPLIEEIYAELKKQTNLHLCASFGIASKDVLKRLKDSGVKTYHHNLETSRGFFPQICTTHSYDDRIATIKDATDVGLEVCSGGIFGLGESVKDRLDMAFDLRKLGVVSVPINILTPIIGTPFEHLAPVDPKEILKTIAVYRFILPNVFLRYAGGRKSLGEFVTLGLKSGINSALTGDFLTTTGDSIEGDKAMIKGFGFEI